MTVSLVHFVGVLMIFHTVAFTIEVRALLYLTLLWPNFPMHFTVVQKNDDSKQAIP